MLNGYLEYSEGESAGVLGRVESRVLRIFWGAYGVSVKHKIPISKIDVNLSPFKKAIRHLSPNTQRQYKYLIRKYLKKNEVYIHIKKGKKKNLLKKQWREIKEKANRKWSRSMSFIRGWAIKNGIFPSEITQDALKSFCYSSHSRNKLGYLSREWNKLYKKGIVPVKVVEIPKIKRQTIKIKIQELPAKLRKEWSKYKKYIIHPHGKRGGWHKVNNKTFEDREKSFCRYMYFLKNVLKKPIDNISLSKVFEAKKKKKKWINAFILWIAEQNKPITVTHYIRNLFIPVLVYYFNKDIKDLILLKKEWQKKFKQYCMPERYQEIISAIDFSQFEKLYEMILLDRNKIKYREGFKYSRLTMTALLVGLLTSIPLRSRTMRVLKIDKNVARTEDGWKIYLYPEDVKGANSNDFWEFDFPKPLVTLLEEYLQICRPRLLQGKQHKYLFVMKDGNPMTEGAFKRYIPYWTEKYLGMPISTHLFRHLVATHLLKKDPGLIFAVSKLLLHKSLETVKRYYLQLTLEESIKMLWEYYPATFKKGITELKNRDTLKNRAFPIYIQSTEEVDLLNNGNGISASERTALKILYKAHKIPLDKPFPLSIYNYEELKRTAKIYRYLIRRILKQYSVDTNLDKAKNNPIYRQRWKSAINAARKHKMIGICVLAEYAIQKNIGPAEMNIDFIKMEFLPKQRNLSLSTVVKMWNRLNKLYEVKNGKRDRIVKIKLVSKMKKKVVTNLKFSEIPKKIQNDWKQYLNKNFCSNGIKLSTNTLRIVTDCLITYISDLKFKQSVDIKNLTLSKALRGPKAKKWIENFFNRREKEVAPGTMVICIGQFFIPVLKSFKEDVLYLRKRYRHYEQKLHRGVLPKYQRKIAQINYEDFGAIPWILYNKSKKSYIKPIKHSNNKSWKRYIPKSLNWAKTGRDAAIFALLELVPMRSNTLAKLKIGRNIEKKVIGGKSKFVFKIYSDDIKSGKRDRFFNIPDFLTPIFKWYYEECRPIILGKRNSEYYFLTFEKEKLPRGHLCKTITDHTKKHLNIAVNTHLFRAIIATKILNKNPRLLVPVTELLMDESVEIVKRKYIEFSSLDAQKVINKFRENETKNTNPQDKSLSIDVPTDIPLLHAPIYERFDGRRVETDVSEI